MSFPRAVATVLLMMIKEEVFQFAFLSSKFIKVIKCCLQNYKKERKVKSS